jgi:two-component system, chemotaxis family, CheB/CheR fusion protein
MAMEEREPGQEQPEEPQTPPTPSDEERPETEGEAPSSRETPDEEPEPVAAARESLPCPVVGVGASAGGLEALQGLLEHLPTEPPMAFVIVQHRAADRTSVMQSLLERRTTFTVLDIQDGVKVRPKTIYLAPADRDVSILNGRLYLVEPPPHAGVHLPVDSFLRSLARDQAERSICIILSGTGSDGTLGAKEVKAAGGMVMAQKEDQAKYDSMPRSTIETGVVDFILPVEKMGEQLARYIRHPFLKSRRPPDVEKDLEENLQRVFLQIRTVTGHDFSHYKRSTVQRRIARRLAVHQIEDLGQYVKLLQGNPDEVLTLAREMLITVTNFFRDPGAFAAFQERAIRPLVAQRQTDVPIRIWVTACATGEEAYSIAILLKEEMEKVQKHHTVQIFASDLDTESVEFGRRGQYPKSIAADVSPERLKRYFTEESSHYKIRNHIREMLVFSTHNLTKDAPFARVDALSCRNVLIYMDTTLQKKLIPMFHYALNPDGYLFLGESESVGTFTDLFTPLDGKHKIFQRRSVPVPHEPQVNIPHFPRPEKPDDRGLPSKPIHELSKLAEKLILRDYSQPCVLVNEDYDVVYFSGDTTPYLAQPGGRPTFNILQLARPEVHYRLNSLLKRAFHEKKLVLEKGIQVRIDDQYLDTDIVVRPILEPGARGSLALVVFQGKPRKEAPEGGDEPVEIPEQKKDARIRELEHDLRSTKEYLQTTVEELQTSNEELKSSIEEMQSSNEELQSTNEELDTSREELQSTNEELRTVNSEHQQKIEELSGSYDDLNNLLAATEMASLFLDEDLRIRRFTPAARKLFRLIDRDIGRPLQDITSSLRYENLAADIQSVTQTFSRIDKEIQDDNGVWYRMKIVPYRTAANRVEGTVMTLIDIDLEKSAGFAQAIVETVREPLLILDGGLHVIAANPAFYRQFQVEPRDTLGRNIWDLGGHQWDIPELREFLERIVPQDTKFEDYIVTQSFPRIGTRTMALNARQVVFEGEATGRILLAIEDITDRKQEEKG